MKIFSRSLWVWVMRVGVVLALVLMFLYGWMIFTPTGYEDFAARHAGEAARVDELLRKGSGGEGAGANADGEAIAIVSLRETTNTTEMREAKEVGAEEKAVDFVQAIRDFDQFGADAYDLPPAEKYLFLQARTGAVVWHRVILRPKSFRDERLPTGAEVEPALREEAIKAAAQMKLPPQLESKVMIGATTSTLSTASTTSTLRTEIQGKLNKKLDEIELFLLAKRWKVSPHDQFPSPRSFPYGKAGFFKLAALAIARADQRGEEAKEARLLARALEAQRILHLAQFPMCGFWIFYQEGGITHLLAPILAAGECRGLGVEGLRRAEEPLRRALVGPAELDCYKYSLVMRANRWIREEKIKPRDNEWHRFMNGVPEAIVNRAVRPIAVRNVERETMDWLEGKNRNYSQFEVVKRLWPVGVMNVLGDEIPEEFMFTVLSGNTAQIMLGMAGERFNSEVQLQRLALAAAVYRRARGRYPESVTDLIPEYLDRAFVESTESGWGICRLVGRTEGEAAGAGGAGGGIAGDDGAAVLSATDECPVFFYFDQNVVSGQDCIVLRVGLPLWPPVEEQVLELLK